jgi:hypothetical protein
MCIILHLYHHYNMISKNRSREDVLSGIFNKIVGGNLSIDDFINREITFTIDDYTIIICGIEDNYNLAVKNSKIKKVDDQIIAYVKNAKQILENDKAEPETIKSAINFSNNHYDDEFENTMCQSINEREHTTKSSRSSEYFIASDHTNALSYGSTDGPSPKHAINESDIKKRNSKNYVSRCAK